MQDDTPKVKRKRERTNDTLLKSWDFGDSGKVELHAYKSTSEITALFDKDDNLIRPHSETEDSNFAIILEKDGNRELVFDTNQTSALYNMKNSMDDLTKKMKKNNGIELRKQEICDLIEGYLRKDNPSAIVRKGQTSFEKNQFLFPEKSPYSLC